MGVPASLHLRVLLITSDRLLLDVSGTREGRTKRIDQRFGLGDHCVTTGSATQPVVRTHVGRFFLVLLRARAKRLILPLFLSGSSQKGEYLVVGSVPGSKYLVYIPMCAFYIHHSTIGPTQSERVDKLKSFPKFS